jgi:hypothetical protein
MILENDGIYAIAGDAPFDHADWANARLLVGEPYYALPLMLLACNF